MVQTTQQLLFLSSPVCFPFRIKSTKSSHPHTGPAVHPELKVFTRSQAFAPGCELCQECPSLPPSLPPLCPQGFLVGALPPLRHVCPSLFQVHA